MNQIKKVSRTKKMRNLISFQNVSSDLMYLQPEKCYSNSKKGHSKTQKNLYLKNGLFLRKFSSTKKDVKLNSLSNMFYEIPCIFN